jgi:hypothetical protein
MTETTLLDHHAAMLAAAAIAPEVIAARGYRSVTTKAELARLGFSARQQSVPTLLVPIWNAGGENGLYTHRPDTPRMNDRGKPVKYEFPRGSRMELDVPPCVRPRLGDPSVPLYFTEGVKKADAAASIDLACVAAIGVWNFRGTNEQGGKALLADFEAIAFNDREVYIVYDSDVMVKPEVHGALVRLSEVLKRRKAHVRYVYLPAGEGGRKTGLDDFIAAGHGVDDLLTLATTELRKPPTDEKEHQAPYFMTDDAIVWNKPTHDGPVPTMLATFRAQITAEVIRDDGVEVARSYEIEGNAAGRPSRRFAIPATSFAAMNWPLEHLGIGAVLSPGMGLRDHCRAAIQLLSRTAGQRHVFTHTGWRQWDGDDVYLHAGGAIGPVGPVENISIELDGSLARYVLPDPPEGAALCDAVQASLDVLTVAPDEVTIPILGAVYRAVLGDADFSVHVAGRSGEGKTELTALAQQHFGVGLDARHLPASWTATGNALEGLAFLAKDAVLTVDDFVAGASPGDAAKLQAAAERIFRAQGNRSSRIRMRADTSIRAPKPPRGVILSSGEDVPRGYSLLARVLVLELPKGGVDWTRLSILQRRAADGDLTRAMAGYLHYLAGAGAGLRHDLRRRALQFRADLSAAGEHRRTPAIVADVLAGWDAFLNFAHGCGALSEDEVARLCSRVVATLRQVADTQAQQQEAAEPANRFIELLRGAFVSGRVHVAGPTGAVPAHHALWGWREDTSAETADYYPRGEQIGWVDDDNLYLEPSAAYAAAQRMARDTGDGFTVTPRTLHRRLHEKGLLMSIDEERGKLVVRRVLASARRYVLHLATAPFSLEDGALRAHRAHGQSGTGESESEEVA